MLSFREVIEEVNFTCSIDHGVRDNAIVIKDNKILVGFSHGEILGFEMKRNSIKENCKLAFLHGMGNTIILDKSDYKNLMTNEEEIENFYSIDEIKKIISESSFDGLIIAEYNNIEDSYNVIESLKN